MDDKAEDEESESSDSGEEADQEKLWRSARVMEGVKKPAWFRQVTHTVKWRNNDKNQSVKEGMEKAQVEEIKLVFNDLKAIEAVKKENIPEGFRVHNTHLVTVEKFLANGEHNKFKSHLVVHGNEQDVMLHVDWSSPMASIHSIMSCLTIAACNPEYVVAKLDVKGAFIHTEMSGTPVYI